MIPRDVVAALYGAVRLARFDAGGLAYFDISVNGFWRSFLAAVLVLPLYTALVAVRYGMADAPGGVGAIVIDGLAYVINWVAFPVVMLTLSKVVDRERNYLRHIIAYNWATGLQHIVSLPLAILVLGGALPMELGAFLSLLVLGWVLIFSGYVAHIALDVPPGTAAGLVLVDLLIGLIVNALAAGALAAP